MTQETKESAFWHWFTANEERLFAYKEMDLRLAAEVSEHLTLVAEGLTFEIGPRGGMHREFTISAGGLYELMDAVTALCASAPKLPRWKIIAFRQPKQLEGSRVSVNGKDIEVSVVQCSLHRELRKLAVVLYFDEYSEDELESWGEIGFILLDAVLGEYRVITEVGSVDFAPPPDSENSSALDEDEDVDVFPLIELPPRFSSLCATYRSELEQSAQTPIATRLAATAELLRLQDEQRWQAVAAEQLDEDEELIVQYTFFASDLDVAESTAAAMTQLGHEEVAIENTHTLIGKAYLIIGSFGRFIRERADLTSVSSYLIETAEKHGVELDGYALQRSAPFSEVDMVIVNVQQLLQLGRTLEAVEFCEQGLSLHGKHPELLVLLAYASVKSGDTASAEGILQGLYPHLATTEAPPTLTWYAACAFALLGQGDEAIKMLEYAIEANPEFIELARTEPDFDKLREEAGFGKLLIN
jgi:tetratricopeptide (TPR) repeat protein